MTEPTSTTTPQAADPNTTNPNRSPLYKVTGGTILKGRAVRILGVDAKGRALVEEVNERPWQTLVESPKQGTVRVSNLERIFRTGEEKDLGRDFTDEEALAHERQWQARYTVIIEERARKSILEGIEQVAARLERAADDIRRELAYEQTDVAEKVKRTQHTVAWLLPNLGAHDLTGHALEWTIANRELQRFLTEGIEPSS